MRVDRLREEFDVRFDACAFDLKPGIPPEGLSREHVYAGRVYPAGYVDNMRQLALDAGIEMKRPPIIPNTQKAHEATEFAREHGKLWQFHRALFAAYWEREENIGDVDALCAVATECGLDAGGLREALEAGNYAKAVKEQMAWGQAAGVTGVPTSIFQEKFALVGAQEYPVYRDIAQRIASGKLKAEG